MTKNAIASQGTSNNDHMVTQSAEETVTSEAIAMVVDEVTTVVVNENAEQSGAGEEVNENDGREDEELQDTKSA